MTQLAPWFYSHNAWSHARHEIWTRCRRKYYYQHIAPAVQGPTGYDIEKIKRLKSLTPKNALMGTLIHEVLEDMLQKQSTGVSVHTDDLIGLYLKKTRLYENTARDTVTEYYNRSRDDTFFDQIRKTGVEQLENFFTKIWPEMKEYTYMRHEKFDRCMAGDTPVSLKVDLVSMMPDGSILITDWKTGHVRAEDPLHSLQMNVYVLWACQFFQKDVEEITGQVVWLSTGTVRSYAFSSPDMDVIQDFITHEFMEMNRTYDIAGYPVNPDINHCISCEFQSICHPE